MDNSIHQLNEIRSRLSHQKHASLIGSWITGLIALILVVLCFTCNSAFGQTTTRTGEPGLVRYVRSDGKVVDSTPPGGKILFSVADPAQRWLTWEQGRPTYHLRDSTLRIVGTKPPDQPWQITDTAAALDILLRHLVPK